MERVLMTNELRLVHFGPTLGVPDPSPFCVKAEAYLRMVGANYSLIRGVPMKSPRGQLPVLLHHRKVIAGSAEIVDYVRELHESPVDDWLSERQRIDAFHLLHSVEDYLYFLLLYQRWLLPKNFEVTRNMFFRGLNPILAFFVSRFVRRQARRRTVAQGVGRYSAEEIDRLAKEGVSMMSGHLGDKPYFMGDRPCWVDCSMFGFICNILIKESPDGAAKWGHEFGNLVEFEQRFRERYFPDFLKQ
jgi:glutathione S-transferase